MDWLKYNNIYEFVKRLPEKSNNEEVLCQPFQQSIEYPYHENPIKPVTKLVFSYSTTEANICYTDRFWSHILENIDGSFLLYNSSLKKCHLQYFKTSLRNFIMDRTLMRFFTGRRAYPILELLDKPKVTIERKHITALGYFLSFLLNKQITFQNEVFEWTRDLEKLNTPLTLYPLYYKEKK